MTDKEKIIAEIERLYCEEAEKYDTSQEIGAKRILDELSKFIKSLPTKKPSEELEKAAKEYVKENCILPEDCNDGDIPYYEECTAAVFKDGANWQKEQMMKSAIDATITSRWMDSHVCLTTKKDIPQIYNGDKVKVIIVKEDEQ